MNPKTITATSLHPALKQVLDDVEFEKQPYIITRFGEPVAELIPVERPA